MEPLDAAELRSLAAAVLGASRSVEGVLLRVADADGRKASLALERCVAATQGPLTRATSELERIAARHDTHSRVRRMARTAVERCQKALGAVATASEAPLAYDEDDRLEQVDQLQRLLSGAQRAARAILVETDGPQAFRETA